jgi:micrococcal nuclease
MGTFINSIPIIDVIDGDTVKVRLGEKDETVRLVCIDTEESMPGSDKPVTRLGIEAARMAKEYFSSGNGELASVDLEFDTEESIESCCDRHRDNYGRLLCYVHKSGENFNLKLIREG